MTIEKRLASAPFQQVTGRTLSGYAVLWGVETAIGGEFIEVFERGAFQATLADRSGKRDIVGIVDHDPSAYLCRTANGTMRLTEDARGLLVEYDLAPTALGDEILALAQRKDLGGLSIGFSVSPGGDSFSGNKRTVREATLYEVSVIRAHAAVEPSAATLSVRALHAGAEADMRRRLYATILGGR
ncbi:HK97 family phage prohead protease [Rhizobium sp. IMFF44]|uniref:HK97 family phage prohead protease n=1 Tax=Rhizobium sp. IMFF44 TaxID=3342350 RepID=UPI0035B988AE